MKPVFDPGSGEASPARAKALRRQTKAQLIDRLLALESRLAQSGAVDEPPGPHPDISESETKFRNLIEGSIQGVLIHRDLKPLFANEAHARMYGYGSPAEVLSLESTMDLVAEHDCERLEHYHRARLRHEDVPARFEYQGVRKDGSLIWLENTSRTVMWEGAPAVQAVVVDITEKKRAEAALQEANDRLEANVEKRTRELAAANEGLKETQRRLDAITNTLPVALYRRTQYADGRGELVPLNASNIRKRMGLPEYDPRLPATLASLRLPEFEDAYNAAVEKSARELSRIDVEYPLRTPDGDTRWVRSISQPVRQANGDIIWDGILVETTENKQTELALRESEQRLVDAVEAQPHGFVLYDADQRIVMWNQAALEIVPWLGGTIKKGMTFEALLRAGLRKGWVPEAVGREEAWLAQRIEHLANPSPEGRELRRGDGRTAFMFERKTSDGGTVAIWMDVTEHRRAEQAIRESEARLSEIFLTSPALIFVSDEETGEILEANPTAISTLGYSYDELVGETTLSLRLWSERSKREEVLAILERDGSVRGFESFLRAKDGREVPFLFSTNRINLAGRDCLLSVLVDISNQKTAEAALRQSEERFRNLFEKSGVGMSLVDADGRYLLANDAMCDLLGYAQDELLDKTVFETVHGEDAAEFERRFDEIVSARSRSVTRELRYRREDGTPVWTVASFSTVAATDRRGSLVIAQVQDITEYKAIEERLRQSQKMEAVGQLTGGVAHDFNNLLSVIIGNLDFLKEELMDDDELASLIDPAMQAALSGAKLNRQLLAFSRKQELSPKVIDLNAHVTGVLEMLRRTLGATIEIEARQSWEPCLAEVDPVQLEAALLNLALNARDAMDEGGRLTIETERVRLDREYAKLRSYMTPGDYVLLAVTDTGVGMPPDVKAQVFDPFFTTKDVGKGSGLGLSMVYGFTKQSGGYIEIESQPGAGTTVKIFLPFKAEEAEDADSAAKGPSATRSETILVVEDDPRLLTLTVKQLNALGYRVLSARNGESALRTMTAEDHVDLLLTDVVMPGGMSGSALVQHAVSRKPSIKVVFMSGYAADAIRRQGEGVGDRPMLQKPFRKPELAEMVRSVLDA